MSTSTNNIPNWKASGDWFDEVATIAEGKKMAIAVIPSMLRTKVYK